MQTEENNELIYMKSYLICKELLLKNFISKDKAEILNSINAICMGVEALDI